MQYTGMINRHENIPLAVAVNYELTLLHKRAERNYVLSTGDATGQPTCAVEVLHVVHRHSLQIAVVPFYF